MVFDRLQVKNKTTNKYLNLINEEKDFKILFDKYLEINRCINPNMEKENILELFKDLTTEVLDDRLDPSYKIDDYIKIKNKSQFAVWAMKKRWVNKILEHENSCNYFLGKELAEYKKSSLINNQCEICVSDEDIYSFELKIKNDLNKWISNNDAYVSEFRYLSEMGKAQIDIAFKYDILFCVIRFIIKNSENIEIDIPNII